MGGFASLAEAAEKAITKASPDVMNKVWEVSFNMKNALHQSKAGTALYETFTKDFHPAVEKHTINLFEFAKQHGSNMTPSEIHGQAKKAARAEVFGQKDEILQGYVKAIEKEKGHLHADNIVDHLNLHLKDAPATGDVHPGLSTLDVNLRRKTGEMSKQPQQYMTKDGKLATKQVQVKGAGNQFIGTPSSYKKVGDVESTVKSVSAAIFAAKAVVPHMATQLNVALAHGALNYFRAVGANLTKGGYEATNKLLIAHGAVSEIAMNEYQQHWAFQNSFIKKYADNSIGSFIHRNYSMPGMTALRNWTVAMSAYAGKLSAEEAAMRFVNHDDSMEEVLKEFNLDPFKIRQNGGKLDPDDMRKVLFHGVDNSVFLPGRAAMNRSKFAQRTMLGRLTTAYHGYIINQKDLISGLLKRDFQRQDYVGMAKTMGMLAVVFPTVGNGIAELERLSRGQDWTTEEDKNPLDRMIKREGRMFGSDGYVDAALSTIEHLSTLGALGVATSYGRAATRSHLLNQLAGPVGNTLGTGAEDIGKAIVEYGYKEPTGGEFHSGPAKALGRDVIRTLPLAGMNTAASHLLLPTAREENAGKPKTAKQMKAALRRRMKHKKGGTFFDEED